MVCGSIFHFHQSPRLRPTPYAESRRLIISPSTPRSRDSARRRASSSQLGASSRGEVCSVGAAFARPPPLRHRRMAAGHRHAASSGAGPRCARRRRLPTPAARDGRERQVADVDAVVLEHVVGHEHDRDVARLARDLLLPADALLQGRERQRPIAANARTSPSSTVPSGSARGGLADLGKAVGDQLLAARPEVHLSAALDELRADAVPLPLDLPARALAEDAGSGLGAGDLVLDGRGQAERIRPREIDRRVTPASSSDVNQAADGVQSPISRAAIVVARQRRRLGQRADHQRLRHADAELAGQQLQQRESLPAIERRAASRSPAACWRSADRACAAAGCVLRPSRPGCSSSAGAAGS